MNAKTLARGLGWFSIGLGLTELLAPRALARFLGVKQGTRLLRAYGLREIAAGVGILLLSPSRPTPWVWARVGGDLLDLATLGKALKDSPKKGNVTFAIGNVVAATALDAYCARRLGVTS
ncbi:hypothetical protein ACLESO_01865 [Pyxidicoccus sp. 3LG]